MSLVDRTKTALDESRMLMLGTQILLGFQFQAPFQDAFPVISAAEKFVVLVALAIITIVAGLLIAPSARHRIVDDGEASPALLRFIAIISTMTMPSLALAIGLDLGVAGMRISGPTLGVLSTVMQYRRTKLDGPLTGSSPQRSFRDGISVPRSDRAVFVTTLPAAGSPFMSAPASPRA